MFLFANCYFLLYFAADSSLSYRFFFQIQIICYIYILPSFVYVFKRKVLCHFSFFINIVLNKKRSLIDLVFPLWSLIHVFADYSQLWKKVFLFQAALIHIWPVRSSNIGIHLESCLCKSIFTELLSPFSFFMSLSLTSFSSCGSLVDRLQKYPPTGVDGRGNFAQIKTMSWK